MPKDPVAALADDIFAAIKRHDLGLEQTGQALCLVSGVTIKRRSRPERFEPNLQMFQDTVEKVARAGRSDFDDGNWGPFQF